MKLSLNWIKDFVDLKTTPTPQELAKQVTLSVCEVEHIEEIGSHLNNIFVGKIVQIDPHPNADKLKLVTIDIVSKQQQVVCGASNYVLNDLVPFADLGTIFPDGLEIKPIKLRGIESKGMLCSPKELGLSDENEGLMILNSSYEVGKTLADIFPDQLDTVFEVDNKSITHRPDLWGHYGFARELASLYDSELKPFNYKNSISETKNQAFQVIDETDKKMRRYTGIGLSDVSIQQSSHFIQQRLYRVGLRAINNIVDITNYVMAALGQPMHAFDIDQLTGNQLVIRSGKAGDKLLHLYEKEVELNETDLIICDGEKPVSIAGVIGGMYSGVTENSKNIFFEAANWDPVLTRKTATRLNVRTDALQRFEKSLDPEMTSQAIEYALHLLSFEQSDVKKITPLFDIYNFKFPQISIDLKISYVHKLLGVKIPSDKIESILSKLGFLCIASDDAIKVTVPSWRATKDVSIQEDLIEEIGRVFGYNNIEEQVPFFPIEKPKVNTARKSERKIKQFFTSNQFNEIYTYPLSSRKVEQFLNLDFESFDIQNPVTENQTFLRRSLIPQHLEKVQENLKSSKEFKLFEIGRVYKKDGENSAENDDLLFSISSQTETLEKLFYAIKSITNQVQAQLQLEPFDYLQTSGKGSFIHPYISSKIVLKGVEVGDIFTFSPEFREEHNIDANVMFALLHFSELLKIGKKEFFYEPLNKYPPVNFRVSIIAPAKMFYQEIEKLIYQMDKRIEMVSFGDVFYLPNDPTVKSISIDMLFRSNEKTLKPDEVEQLQNTVIKKLSGYGYNLKEV